jgi:hypothetical protein
MNDKTYQQITSRMAEISKKHKLPSTVSQMWTVLFKHQGANMTEEDEAFNEIERRAKQRMEAVRAAMRGEDDDIQEHMSNVILFNGITKLDLDPDMVLENTKGKLEGVILIGYDKEGEEYFASTYADGGDVLWLLERMKLRLLNVENNA